jgi:mRNA-degrading endonuclease RelE of RelBE toxin-antitoxin system
MTNQKPIQVIVSSDFNAQARKLKKRYRSFQSDLKTLTDELEVGNLPGDQISGTTAIVYKVRLKNSDIKKGKSGGYRVIYQQRNDICILLVTLYSKSDESNITAKEIQTIIDHFDQADRSQDTI